MQTDPVASKSISFHCGQPKTEEENGNDLKLWHQKGQTSKEIINSTWATSSPSQWKEPMPNPRKGHRDCGVTCRKRQEWEPASCNKNQCVPNYTKRGGWAQRTFGFSHNNLIKTHTHIHIQTKPTRKHPLFHSKQGPQLLFLCMTGLQEVRQPHEFGQRTHKWFSTSTEVLREEEKVTAGFKSSCLPLNS